MTVSARALQLIKEGELAFGSIELPDVPDSGAVRVRMKAVSLNHIDLFGVRGMAFARRALPLVVGVRGGGSHRRRRGGPAAR